jgi:hypothetical protein
MKTPDVLRSLRLATSGGARRLFRCRFQYGGIIESITIWFWCLLPPEVSKVGTALRVAPFRKPPEVDLRI